MGGVQAQEAPGGGSGMALLLLLRQTPGPSSSYNSPLLTSFGGRGRCYRGGKLSLGAGRAPRRPEGAAGLGPRARGERLRMEGSSCQTPGNRVSNSLAAPRPVSPGTRLQQAGQGSAGCGLIALSWAAQESSRPT